MNINETSPALSFGRGRASAVIPAGLRFENVGRSYGAVKALEGVSFSVKEGEVLCLLGQSGCGKSTLLRLAAGIETLSTGQIFLDGEEISSPDSMRPPEQRGIGLVFQDYALFPHLSVLQNVMFGLNRLPKAERPKVALAALERVGLLDKAQSLPDVLSGGEQQRVALARAVVPRPRVLLMDEPFSNLDARLRDSVRAETMQLIKETGATAIIVTHDPEEALRIADRIVLLRKGRLLQIGAPQELYQQPENIFAARFFCDLNEIAAEVENGNVQTPFGAFPTPQEVNGKRLIFALRPQQVRLAAPDYKPRAYEKILMGRVLERRFLGETEAYEIAIPDYDRPLHVRLPVDAAVNLMHESAAPQIKSAAVQNFSVGDDVCCAFFTHQLLVFSDHRA